MTKENDNPEMTDKIVITIPRDMYAQMVRDREIGPGIIEAFQALEVRVERQTNHKTLVDATVATFKDLANGSRPSRFSTRVREREGVEVSVWSLHCPK